MEKLELNLGSFNQCVEYISNIQDAEYPCDFYTGIYKTEQCPKIFFYMGHHGNIITVDLCDDAVVIPTFNIGANVNNGKINDINIVKNLLCQIEMEIFSLITRIFRENKIDFNLEKIVIPVREISIFDDDKSDGCYGWAQIGVAVFS